MFNSLTWHPGINNAFCPTHERPPAAKCNCGFNAYHSLSLAKRHHRNYPAKDNVLLGAIAGRGQTQVHHQGFRCQQAQVLAFLAPRKYHGRYQIVAATFKVPLFSSARKFKRYVNKLVAPAPAIIKPDGPNFRQHLHKEMIEEYKLTAIAGLGSAAITYSLITLFWPFPDLSADGLLPEILTLLLKILILVTVTFNVTLFSHQFCQRANSNSML